MKYNKTNLKKKRKKRKKIERKAFQIILNYQLIMTTIKRMLKFHIQKKKRKSKKNIKKVQMMNMGICKQKNKQINQKNKKKRRNLNKIQNKYNYSNYPKVITLVNPVKLNQIYPKKKIKIKRYKNLLKKQCLMKKVLLNL